MLQSMQAYYLEQVQW